MQKVKGMQDDIIQILLYVSSQIDLGDSIRLPRLELHFQSCGWHLPECRNGDVGEWEGWDGRRRQ